jgi:nitrite reductase/ring-hydroxylating ferredoxin subunit
MTDNQAFKRYRNNVDLIYQDILARDGGKPPAEFIQCSQSEMGSADLSTDVYTSREIHDLEFETMWNHTWQMACREHAVAEPGTYSVYDIGKYSVIVVRGNDKKLRGFINSCPHRGTRLCDGWGNLQRIRCAFHGFSWELEGTLKEVPCSWDFPQVDSDNFGLPEALVGTWGGFVFINLDPDAKPLSEYLGRLPEHFQRWPMEDRYVASHVGKYIDCNWKVVIEAFLETLHVIGLHPESLKFFGDINSQYDVWEDEEYFSRMINPSGITSPHLKNRANDETVLTAAKEFGLCDPAATLDQSNTPRHLIAETIAQRFKVISGVDISDLHISEILDVVQYDIFPNLIVFAAYGSPLAYRVTPAGGPEKCLFEVYLLLPFSGDRPDDAAYQRLEDNEKFGDIEALTYYGGIIDQDVDMMPRVQRGLYSSQKQTYTLSAYQESRIRHMRETLDKYLSFKARAPNRRQI